LKSSDFRLVRRLALAMPDVEDVSQAGRKQLKLRGVFLAAIAIHPSAEPNTLVVRSPIEERDLLIEDAPETYYLTDYYRPYPLVLVRLSHVGPDALRGLLSVSWRMSAEKTRKRSRSKRHAQDLFEPHQPTRHDEVAKRR
jgi:hypothetical protein